MDSKNDEYESIPLREGEYLIRPETRVPGVHKWLSKIEEEGLPQDD